MDEGRSIVSFEPTGLLNLVPDAMLVVDRQERIVFANAMALAMFRAGGDGLVGSGLSELLPDATRHSHHARVASYFQAPTTRPMGSGRALNARRLDGSELPVEIALAPARIEGREVVIAVLRDRTAQQETERARFAAEEHAASALAQLDLAPVEVVHLDRAGRIAHVNAAWSRFARENGADPATAAGVGLDYLEVCRRDLQARPVIDGLQAIIAGRATSFEHHYRCNSPTELRRFVLRAEALPAGGGVVLVHTDVTARELADERLAVQRHVAAALAADRPVLEVCRELAAQVCQRLEWDLWELWGSDGAGGARRIDHDAPGGGGFEPLIEGARTMVLRPGEGLLGRVWGEQAPEWVTDEADPVRYPRFAVAVACGVRTACAVPLASGEETFLLMSFCSRVRRRKDGATVELLMAIGAQIAEVARRQRAEQIAHAAAAEVTASRAKLQALLQDVPGIIVEVDREGHVKFLNRQRAVPVEQVLGRHWLWAVPAARRPPIEALFGAVLEDGEPRHYEVEVEDANGESQHYTGRIGALRAGGAHGADSAITGAVIVAQEVTEQRRMQAELDDARRLATVGALAAGVAHEINNPLASVIANLTLALDDTAALVPPSERRSELLEELRDAQNGAERIRGIAQDLKVLARPHQEASGPVDARAVFESMLRLAANELRHRAQVLRDYQEVPAVEVVEGRLGQVLLNLLLNAAQAIPEGQADRHQVNVATRLSQDGMVCLEVSDTGAGMSDDVKKRLFTPFFTTKSVGTGLGLSVCDKIVRGFGGRIEVDSELGRGTTFRVLLPPSRGEARVAPAAAPAASTSRRAQVLLIDDDAAIGRAVQRTLGHAHDVTVTSRASEALALLERGGRFDVILCDLMMPEMTGPELLDELARRFPDQADRVMVITGGAFTERGRRFLETTTLTVVSKPFEPARLLEVVAGRVRELLAAAATGPSG